MSVMLSAASCLKWFVQLSGAADEAALLSEVQALPTADLLDAPIFLPYLAGERTPHNNPFAQGMFCGLTHATTRAHCAYAVLEGVAFGLADGLAALQASGTEVSQLSLVGGGARSSFWAQLIADALNVEIVLHTGGEAGGALGAARLGWLAAGGDVTQVCTQPAISARHKSDATRHAQLQSRLQRYRDIYQRLKSLPSLASLI
jgi:xylulokinase